MGSNATFSGPSAPTMTLGDSIKQNTVTTCFTGVGCTLIMSPGYSTKVLQRREPKVQNSTPSEHVNFSS